MAVPSAPPPTATATATADKANGGLTLTGNAPLKDDFAAKLPAREALKERNQRYWEEDAYSESDRLSVHSRCRTRLSLENIGLS
jgi:hypothetical protein